MDRAWILEAGLCRRDPVDDFHLPGEDVRQGALGAVGGRVALAADASLHLDCGPLGEFREVRALGAFPRGDVVPGIITIF